MFLTRWFCARATLNHAKYSVVLSCGSRWPRISHFALELDLNRRHPLGTAHQVTFFGAGLAIRASPNALRYLLTDQQGSIEAITDGAGTNPIYSSFTPLGLRRDPIDWSGSPSSTPDAITRQGCTFQTVLGRSASQAARLNRQLASQEIANGHAFVKHVVERGEPASGLVLNC